MKAYSYQEQLEALRKSLIQEIIDFVKSKKAVSIQLDKEIYLYQIDDQESATINLVTEKGAEVAIPYQKDILTPYDEIGNDHLISVLLELQMGRFSIYEEKENEQNDSEKN